DSYVAALAATLTPQAFASKIADLYAEDGYVKPNPYTIATLDLTHTNLNTLETNTSKLAEALANYALDKNNGPANRATLMSLRHQVQKFDSLNNGRLDDKQEYVDLDHWAQLVQGGVADSTIKTAAANVRSALKNVVINEHHASGNRDRGNDKTFMDLS